MLVNSVLNVLQFGFHVASRLRLISFEIQKHGNKVFFLHRKIEKRAKIAWKYVRTFVFISFKFNRVMVLLEVL